MSDGERVWRLNPDEITPREAGIVATDYLAWELQKKPHEAELEFNADIFFYAFRYCLGRMTYAVGVMAEYLIANADKIDEKHRHLIVSEITEAINNNSAGHQMDVEQWERVRARLSTPVKVTTFFVGAEDEHVAYPLNEHYYMADMRRFISTEYITKIEK